MGQGRARWQGAAGLSALTQSQEESDGLDIDIGTEIGIDIGGTFTDAVLRGRHGSLRSLKVPSTPDDPARAVGHALHGTDLTVPLRAVLELVVSRGPLTVPQLAREFGVTRQSVQVLVASHCAPPR